MRSISPSPTSPRTCGPPPSAAQNWSAPPRPAQGAGGEPAATLRQRTQSRLSIAEAHLAQAAGNLAQRTLTLFGSRVSLGQRHAPYLADRAALASWEARLVLAGHRLEALSPLASLSAAMPLVQDMTNESPAGGDGNRGAARHPVHRWQRRVGVGGSMSFEDIKRVGNRRQALLILTPLGRPSPSSEGMAHQAGEDPRRRGLGGGIIRRDRWLNPRPGVGHRGAHPR